MSKRGWILLAAVIPVGAFFSLLAWASIKSDGNPGRLGINRNFGEVRLQKKAAGEFSLETLEKRTISLSGLRGKVVMIDFWASWCPPCRQEAAGLAEVYREYAGRPVEFIGIDIWDRDEDALQHIKRYNIAYPNGVDRRGNITVDYGVRGIPEKFFIDREGFLVKKSVGPMPKEKLKAILDDLLASGPAPGQTQ